MLPALREISTWSSSLVNFRSTAKSVRFYVDCSMQFDFRFPPMNSRGDLRIPIFLSEFQYMALTIFAEKDFSMILSDINGYGHVFLDRTRE